MLDDVLIPSDIKNPVDLLEKLKRHDEEYWIARGQKRMLHLFKQMAQRVPAYRDFLKKNKVKVELVKTISDFKSLPTVDKDNYLRLYPLEQLCWDGVFKQKQWVFSTTSGSTGEPYYFPRSKDQDLQYAICAEAYMRSNFSIHKKSTLYIDGFAMGAWIGGLFTYQAIKYVVERGDYKLSIITPGIFKREIIKALRNLGEKFDQVIIGGYPPMIKDMIDDAIFEGVDFRKYELGFIFSAEGFNEKFRDYIIKKTGLKDVLRGTLNHYGTVDLGTMAHETPVSILIRRLLVADGKLKSIFPEEHKQPTLCQFLPELFYFEEVDNSLVCSAFSGLPLVRYDLKDYGGVITIDQIRKRLADVHIELDYEIDKNKIGNAFWNLPFVYIYERKDFTVKLYGANIYPESIRKVLHREVFEDFVSGKFTMEIVFDDKQNQRLAINIELKTGIMHDPKGLKEKIREEIVQQLLNENSEYRSNYKESPTRQVPVIYFWEYEHPEHFVSGGKQKWVKK